MSESLCSSDADEFVQVICDYEYQKDGRTISIKTGEVFFLLKRANNDWWQVIRRGDRKPFYAPAQYMKVTTLTKEIMLKALQEEKVKVYDSQTPVAKLLTTKETPKLDNNDSVSNKNIQNKKDLFPTSDVKVLQADTLSIHTSKSSLSSGIELSNDSLNHAKDESSVSHDRICETLKERELDYSPIKSASSDDIDRHSGFSTNSLSVRNRSNSVDFKILTSDNKVNFDKSRKVRLCRDPANRRKSWAVEESHSIDPSLYRNRAESPDSSVVLDIPPKLPPKLHKQNKDSYGSCEDLVDINKSDELKSFVSKNISFKRGKINFQNNKPVALPRKEFSTFARQANSQVVDVNCVHSKNVDLLPWPDNVESEAYTEKTFLNDNPEDIHQVKFQHSLYACKQAPKSPPTPHSSPKRIVFDSWGEYIDISGRPYYYNATTHEKRWKPPRKTVHSVSVSEWYATSSKDGKIYFYDDRGSRQWQLPLISTPTYEDNRSNTLEKAISLELPPSPKKLSSDNVYEFDTGIGEFYYTFCLKEGKKYRKNWSPCYLWFNRSDVATLLFTKNKENLKNPDRFEFFPKCYIDENSEKKSSRSNVLVLRNGQNTEVLLQSDSSEIRHNLISLLKRKQQSTDSLNVDQKGIRDKLKFFIKRRPTQKLLRDKGIYQEAVFGNTISSLCAQDGCIVPYFVEKCISCLEANSSNLSVDGIYRISGNTSQIQKIRFEVAKKNYSFLEEEKEVHNLTGALKLFFRELREPLIPYSNYDSFIQATGSEFRRINRQADTLKKAVSHLPKENEQTLKFLLEHLIRDERVKDHDTVDPIDPYEMIMHSDEPGSESERPHIIKVSKYEKENRMSIMNLAIVFGPCLLWPEITIAQNLMTDVMLHNRVVEGLLSDFNIIFGETFF